MKPCDLRFQVVVLACLLMAAAIPAWAAEKWTAPSIEAAPAQLPRLSAPLTIDGTLSEWADAASIPMRARSYISYINPSHEWRGPADAALEFLCAWTPKGLCLSATLTDDDVRNDIEPAAEVWKQDSVLIAIDGRAGDDFLTMPRGTGFITLSVRPPTPDRPAAVYADPEPETTNKIQFAAKSTSAGYDFEILVPWEAFPGLAPSAGASIALQLCLVEYDARDGGGNHPVLMFIHGVRDPWTFPEEMTRWTLVEQPARARDIALGPQVALDLSPVALESDPSRISLELGRTLSATARSVTLVAVDPDGEEVSSHTAPLQPLPAPWQDSLGAQIDWQPAGMSYGYYYTLRIIVKDGQGRPLGSTARPVLYLGDFVAETIARLDRVGLSALSQTDPFRAAAYLGPAACLERFRHHVEKLDTTMMASTSREIEARLDLLADRKLDMPSPGLFDLLSLTAEPAAQTVVEYSSNDFGVVSFYWGSIPIASVFVSELSGPEEEAAFLDLRPDQFLSLPVERTTLDGLPASISHQKLDWAASALSLLDPGKQILLFDTRDPSAEMHALDIEQISWARVDAATIMPGCPEPARRAVASWAEQANLPLMEFADACEKDRILLAGDFQAPAVLDRLGEREVVARKLVQGFTRLVVISGDRALDTRSPSQAVAEKALRLVLAGAPVTPADVDAMRAALLQTIPDHPAAPVEGADLHCGDLHMHTLHSDGAPSPEGLMLQAMHVFLDFAAITDHNTIESARAGKRLLAEYGFAYPVTIGEEITTEWAHFNAFPLTENIPADLSAYEIVERAHSQGAVIQWNHPGWPPSDWATAHLGEGFWDTGLDAWEHIPGGYDQRCEAGRMPVITGTTDTHDGTFSPPERTVVLAPAAQGEDVAEAIRRNRVVAVSMGAPRQFYGQASMLALLRAALEEGDALKAATERRLKDALREADLAGLLRASQPRP